MKTLGVFKVMGALALLTGISFQAIAQGSQDSVTLESRYTIGDYITATYSFRYATRDDVDLTLNNWDILFEARQDFDDFFVIDTVVDDQGVIFDLGNKDCRTIWSPMVFLEDDHPAVLEKPSNARQEVSQGTNKATVNEGHCYLMYVRDRKGEVSALFNVAEHIHSESVQLKNIEVLFKEIWDRR